MKSKKIVFVLGMALFSALFGITASMVQADVVQLTYSNFFPPTHFNHQLAESWGKEIETRTKGAVKFTYFPGGALLKGPEMFDGVIKGVSDIGMSLFAYTAGRFPSMEALDLPMGYPNGNTATMIANDFYKKYRPKELDGVKVLLLHAHGPGLLHAKKEINRLEDLKGLKIRCTGFSAKAAAALGGVPVAMGQGGAYEALQKGVVEATLTPIETLKGWKQAEVVKYTIECYSVGYTTAMYVIMNEKKWNALPKEVQKVFEDVSSAWIPKHGQGWDQADKEGREFTLSLGNKVIPLSDEQSKLWASKVAPVIDEYVGVLEGKGLPGKEYVQFIRDGIKKYGKK
ncbi:MAG: C4-dicarboxylate ABC transporter substrate-binding protein [Desulfobacteraceae bacterium]|nr:MAG: C4-dicarboxylate ABC transporter substrate-binding protein [Desulfobacteraceae bacterium]